MNYTTYRLRQIRSQLAAVVLIVEDGECDLPLAAVGELRRIESYLDRISARIEPPHRPVLGTSSGDIA